MTELEVTESESPQVVGRKPMSKSINIEVHDAEEMSLEIAQRLLKLNVDAHELEIIRTNTLQKDIAYSSLNADQRRVIDYMCRSLKVDEIERDGRVWRTSFDFFRKLFPDPKTHEEIKAILLSLKDTDFNIRNVKTGRVEIFSWLNEVNWGEKGTIEIEITARVSEYHRIPNRAEISAYGGYTHYYLTASLGLLLQHQNFFHHVLGRRVEWGLKHRQVKVAETPIEITVEEMRHLWGLSQDTKPYDLERYWLKDACERMAVATQVHISHYEPLRAPTRGRPVYAYRLYLTEVTKVDFLSRFERFLELAKANRSAPKQAELPLNGADDRAQRLKVIKDKLRSLGAYRGQLQELESLTEAEIVWVEGQLAVWDWAGDAIHKHYKNQPGRQVKSIALLWRCIKHRLALQAEYPEAFLAIERQKKRVQVKKTEVEPEYPEDGNNSATAQQMAQWFSSLSATEQEAFMEKAIRDVPHPNLEKLYRNGFKRVFQDGMASPTLPVFQEIAVKNGYQAAPENQK
jgi:hypothetical protein